MDPDQLVSQMPADLALHCFQKRVGDLKKAFGQIW